MNTDDSAYVQGQFSLSIYRFQKIILFGVVACCLGCAPSQEGAITRYEIKGNVTYNGLLVPQGTIQFSPDTEKGNSGPGSTGVIEDGTFTIPAERGVVGGSYLVLINGYGSSSAPAGEGTGIGPPLFEEYKTSVELPRQTAVHDFSIPGK